MGLWLFQIIIKQHCLVTCPPQTCLLDSERAAACQQSHLCKLFSCTMVRYGRGWVTATALHTPLHIQVPNQPYLYKHCRKQNIRTAALQKHPIVFQILKHPKETQWGQRGKSMRFVQRHRKMRWLSYLPLVSFLGDFRFGMLLEWSVWILCFLQEKNSGWVTVQTLSLQSLFLKCRGIWEDNLKTHFRHLYCHYLKCILWIHNWIKGRIVSYLSNPRAFWLSHSCSISWIA